MNADLIEEVIATGSAFVPDALGVSWIDAIRADINRIEWAPQYKEQNPWLQYEDAKIGPDDPFPAINRLRLQLESQIRALMTIWPCLRAYRANDVTAQHYRDEHDGIGTHCDYSLDRLLIAVYTVRGHGPFEIMTAREGGTIARTYETQPGSLNLLWAPDLVHCDRARRPPHRILRPQDNRTSITYRYTIGTKQFPGEWRPYFI